MIRSDRERALKAELEQLPKFRNFLEHGAEPELAARQQEFAAGEFGPPFGCDISPTEEIARRQLELPTVRGTVDKLTGFFKPLLLLAVTQPYPMPGQTRQEKSSTGCASASVAWL